MSNASKRVFNNIEEINQKFGVDLNLPEHSPEGCNLLCYEVVDLYDVQFFHHYKLVDDELYHYVDFRKEWRLNSNNLEQEIEEDINNNSKYIYLHLKEDDKPKEINMNKHIFESLVKLNASYYFPLILPVKDRFTPERLLGVETTLGFITTIIGSNTVMLSRNNDYFYNLNLLKYYISDDSDETVSFEEYVKLFYNTGDTL